MRGSIVAISFLAALGGCDDGSTVAPTSVPPSPDMAAAVAGADMTAVAGADMTPPPAGAKTVTVTVGPGGAIAFSPASIDINAGDTVNWVWSSSAIPHTVTSGTVPTADGQFCSNSGAQNASACSGTGFATTAPFSFSHTFPTAGTFPYFCAVHLALMTGTVIVH
jgi:plastocyanin